MRDFDFELKMRGPPYYISLTVENMPLNGREILCDQFPGVIEQSARQAGQPVLGAINDKNL